MGSPRRTIWQFGLQLVVIALAWPSGELADELPKMILLIVSRLCATNCPAAASVFRISSQSAIGVGSCVVDAMLNR